MRNNQQLITIIAAVVHAICALAMCWLLTRESVPIIVVLVTGVLIGGVSIPTVSHRIWSLFAGFGLMVGASFWITIGILKIGDPVMLLLPILLAGSAAWVLQSHSIASAALLGFSMCLSYLSNYASWRNRFENDFSTPEQVVTSVILLAVLVSVAGLELGWGLVEANLPPPPRKSEKPKKAKRAIVRD